MQMENFTTIQCHIFLRDNDKQGIITNENCEAFICTPNTTDNNEQTHISANSSLLEYISNEHERNPNIEIFAITKNKTIEITINSKGLFIPKS